MGHYDHRVHAGNAGDVWKHFLLLEAADCLLDPDGSLVYAESHVGRPEYALRAPGDWEGGIGKIWPLLPSLRNFCYFDILADLNPESPSFVPPQPVSNQVSGSISGPFSRPLLYPGSARLIYELAKRKGANLQADVWDNDPGVASSWESFTQAAAAKSTGSFPPAKIVFHQGDGFLGVLSRLKQISGGTPFHRSSVHRSRRCPARREAAAKSQRTGMDCALVVHDGHEDRAGWLADIRAAICRGGP